MKFRFIHSVVILIALSVACTASVVLEGFYIKYQWYRNGPNPYTYQVGGVVIDKPKEFTEYITKRGIEEIGYGPIQCLLMDFNNMKYMPANYSRFFTSIKYLLVRKSHVKYIKNADFIELKSIIHIDFNRNDIEHLPGNLFQGVSKTLITVAFGVNKITNIGLNFMSHIPQIVNLVLEANPCISMSSPAIINSFIIAIRTKCQLKIMPDVPKAPPPICEDCKAIKLCEDKGKLSSRNQTVLKTLT